MENPNNSYFTFSNFGDNWDFVRFKDRTEQLGDWPYITQYAYNCSIGVITGLACLLGLTRTFITFRRRGNLDQHDYLFLFALVTSLVSAVFNICASPYFFIEGEVEFYSVFFINISQIPYAIGRYLEIAWCVSAVQWLSIYSVKLCYLLFFKKLTSRLRAMTIWWWIVLVISLLCYAVTTASPAYACSHFGVDIMKYCAITDVISRGLIIYRVTGALDILTDFLIISIPILLLVRLKIDFWRKITIASILSLSAVMVIISLVRMFPPKDSPVKMDTTWFFFWVSFESSIGILMVSITASRSIFTNGSSNQRSPQASSRHTSSTFTRLRRNINGKFNKAIGRDQRSSSLEQLTNPDHIQMPRKGPTDSDERKWNAMIKTTFESKVENKSIAMQPLGHSAVVVSKTAQPLQATETSLSSSSSSTSYLPTYVVRSQGLGKSSTKHIEQR